MALFLALGLGACGPLPKPFARGEGDAPNPLADDIFREGIEVEPLSGTSPPMGRMLAEAVVRELERTYEIPAATGGLSRSKFILTGHVLMNDTDPDARTLVSIGWQVDAREGEAVDAFVQDIPTTRLEWEYGSPDLLRRIGASVATRVAKQVLGDRFGTAGQDRLLGRKGVHVAQITGAPGDGNQALRRAMAVSLGGFGYSVTSDPGKALFTVTARVAVGPPDQGAQTVDILWTVADAAGQQIGKAEQSNAVPAGSLDGRWGQTAAFVAAAVSDGLVRIISANDPSKLRAPNLGGGAPSPQPPAPSPPRLRHLPGRAPPPPGS